MTMEICADTGSSSELRLTSMNQTTSTAIGVKRSMLTSGRALSSRIFHNQVSVITAEETKGEGPGDGMSR